MGKRSRNRTTVAAEPTPAPRSTGPSKTSPRPPDRRARLGEAPKAAWSPFPLTELSILIALVLLGVGLFAEGTRRGTVLGAGLVLMTLASGELAVREHFAGYRSHSGLIAALVAIVVAAPLYLLTGVPPEAILVVSALVFAVGFKVLRDLFAQRSGGLKFRA